MKKKKKRLRGKKRIKTINEYKQLQTALQTIIKTDTETQHM